MATGHWPVVAVPVVIGVLDGHVQVTGVRAVDAGHDREQGRFAGPAGAEQRVYLAGFDGQVDTVERAGEAEGFLVR